MATGTLAATTAVPASRAATSLKGASPTATDGDNFANTGVERLVVYNPEASSVNCTFDNSAALVDGVAPATGKVVNVAAGDVAHIGPFPVGTYGSTAKVTCALTGAGSLANVKLKVVTF